MRASRTLLLAVGAVAAAGLLDMAASAAGFSLRTTTTSGTSSTSSTASAPPASVSSPSPTATSQVIVSREEITSALFALAAGGKTLAGPGTFAVGADGNTQVYLALSGPAVDACVTVRNLSAGEIRVSASGASSLDVAVGETRSACYGGLSLLDLACRQGARCEAVWRVDRQ